MAAAGGGAADLAEQIRLLREQNRLLVQQNEQLSLQGGEPRFSRAQRRRFVDAPSLDDPEDDRVFLIPAQLERGANAHRIPTDAAGALGEPHLLNVTSEHVYLHAIEKGKSHDATILRVLISALTYSEVLESGLLLARERVSTFESVATGTAEALEAVLGPEPAPPADGGGDTVRLKCDNLATVHVINSGTSRSPALMAELRSLYRLLDRHRITLKVEYIASRDNVDADRLSRHRDTSDWRLTRREFLRYGKGCTIDRFGSSTNAQLPRFNSAWHCPGTSGVDAFAQPEADWRKHHNWCNPPWVLLDRLSRHLQGTGASAVVAAPAWDHTPWHSLLRSLATRINRINAYAGLFTPGRDLPARHIRAPRWDVDVFTIPRRAPQRSFEDELPGLARLLRA